MFGGRDDLFCVWGDEVIVDFFFEDGLDMDVKGICIMIMCDGGNWFIGVLDGFCGCVEFVCGGSVLDSGGVFMIL